MLETRKIQELEEKNHDYWIDRATGYSEVNKEELSGVQRKTWAKLLDKNIRDHFEITEDKRSSIRILDIGAGPGFLSIILTELGYKVTAADFAETMLEQARENAGDLAKEISFKIENAMDLTFENEKFDVVISRNLTWNLPDPQKAYEEWLRVLKPKGLMMVFDANWYAHLRDEEQRLKYDKDRENVRKKGYGDYNIGENFDVMDAIADKMPLTGIQRPEWDQEYLIKKGVSSVVCVLDIGSEVYSEKEKVNYASTPMFMIKVVK